MYRQNNEKLESLRNSCQCVDLGKVEQRRGLLDEFDASIEAWPGLLPIDLRDYFRPEQIECLLLESMGYWAEGQKYNLIERFVSFVARSGYRDNYDADVDVRRTTPLHRLARQTTNHNWGVVACWLFKIFDRFDVNFTDESGRTHFHVACEHGLEDVVRKFLELGLNPNCLVPETGDSPLHLAVAGGHAIVARTLLRRGAVPNLINAKGSTPLDLICRKTNEDEAAMFLQVFYDNSEAFRQTINNPNERGERPLEVAVSQRRLILARALLTSGADPNAYNASGLTPLHEICQRDDSSFFESEIDMINRVRNEMNHRERLSINELNQLVSKRPWLLGLELLLRHGADPNQFSRDHRGGTALHIICQRKHDEGLVKTLLLINDVVGRGPVLLDALDTPHRRTPLQLAIMNVQPDTVEALLARGADLAKFVFPEKYFSTMPVPELNEDKLRLVSGLLACVERLEKKGYNLTPRDTLTVAKLLLRCEFLDRSANVRWLTKKAIDKYCVAKTKFEDECKILVEVTKKLMITPGLSFFNLMRQPDQARGREFTATDCYELTRRNAILLWLRGVDLRYDLLMIPRLGQIMAREFCFRRRTTLTRFKPDEFLNSCLKAASM